MSDEKIPVRDYEEESKLLFPGRDEDVTVPSADPINDPAFALKEKTPDWTQKYWG